MVLKRPRKSCAPSLHNPLPSGSSPTLSCSSTPFLAPPSANSKNSLSANNLQIGSGNPRPRPRCWTEPLLESSTASFLLGAITRIDTHVLSCEIAGPVTGHGFARVQIHDEL